MCVCVCVRERERERERDYIFKYIYYALCFKVFKYKSLYSWNDNGPSIKLLLTHYYLLIN